MIHMPRGAKVLKDLLCHKEKLKKAASSVKLSEECSAIIQKSLPQKEGDPRSFMLPCLIRPLTVKNALANLGANINLMPYFLFKRFGISKLKPTHMSIQLADRSLKYPIGVYENLLVKINKFIFPVDFMVFKMDEDELVLIILGRPFLVTARVVIDVYERKLSLRVGSEIITFNIGKLMKSKYPRDNYFHCADQTVVPKKGGMTVVKNEKDERIPQRTVTGWRVCIDYCKLNDATRKDHFSLPFIDQMLEHQEKTTHCPYGTFAYKWMPFGLCNAPATFQRCMTAIFHELIKDNMEVFMDDFFVFASSFDHCLKNLEKMLKRCEETNLVLNWKKCHFTVKEGIVLGHKVSGSRIEVDKAKIKDAKPRLIIWILLLLEFDVEIRDKKGAKNLAADHLSRLKNPDLGKFTRAEIKDLFPEERLMAISSEKDKPWYADYANYLASQVENTNRAIKRILGKTIGSNMKECSYKLDDALWAFRTAFKTLWEQPRSKSYLGKHATSQLNSSIKLIGQLKTAIWTSPKQEKTGRKAHLLEDKQIPSVGVLDEVYFAFGRHLKEIHVTWAHLEKKRTKLRTYTKSLRRKEYNAWRRRSDDENLPPPPPTPTHQASYILSIIKCPIPKKDYPIWEVIQKGNGPVQVSTDTNGQIRFQNLLSQLKIHGASVSHGRLPYLKFIRSLPILPGIKQYNDVSTAYGVSTSYGYNSQRENSLSYTDELIVLQKTEERMQFDAKETSWLSTRPKSSASLIIKTGYFSRGMFDKRESRISEERLQETLWYKSKKTMEATWKAGGT
ncbi:reverse transcriptase domain-containing protein [Tanacetum coccineum]